MSQTSLFVACLAFFTLEFWILGTIPVVPGGVVGNSPLSVGQVLVGTYIGVQNSVTPPPQKVSCAWYDVICAVGSTWSAIAGAVSSAVFYVSQVFSPLVYMIGAAAQIDALVLAYPWLGAIDFIAFVFVVYSLVKGFI